MFYWIWHSLFPWIALYFLIGVVINAFFAYIDSRDMNDDTFFSYFVDDSIRIIGWLPIGIHGIYELVTESKNEPSP